MVYLRKFAKKIRESRLAALSIIRVHLLALVLRSGMRDVTPIYELLMKPDWCLVKILEILINVDPENLF
jgi:hypothetical protein